MYPSEVKGHLDAASGANAALRQANADLAAAQEEATAANAKLASAKGAATKAQQDAEAKRTAAFTALREHWHQEATQQPDQEHAEAKATKGKK